MTRSSQQTPAPSSRPRAESAAEGEETAATAAPDTTGAPAATATAAPAPATVPPAAAESAEASTGAEAGQAPEAANEPVEGRTTEPGTGAEPGTEAGPAARSEAETGADPGAAAAARSRLPAFVRTMTATAIGRPQQQSTPVGRPGKAVLAGAAVAGALLVSVPFLGLTGDDDNGPEKVSVAGAGTVLDGNRQGAPGEFAAIAPETGSLSEAKKTTGKPGTPEKPVRQALGPAPERNTVKNVPKKAVDPRAESEDEPQDAPKNTTKDEPDKQSDEQETGGAKEQPAKTGPTVTFSAPVSLRSHLSGRCIGVPGYDFVDGKKLFVWDCDNGGAQQWRFASDGTIRIKDKCLDVANANFNNGTPIQINACNGDAAQQFLLNSSHDLVNSAVGKCVDIRDSDTGNGAWLQLWSCAGSDNQKWSV